VNVKLKAELIRIAIIIAVEKNLRRGN